MAKINSSGARMLVKQPSRMYLERFYCSWTLNIFRDVTRSARFRGKRQPLRALPFSWFCFLGGFDELHICN